MSNKNPKYPLDNETIGSKANEQQAGEGDDEQINEALKDEEGLNEGEGDGLYEITGFATDGTADQSNQLENAEEKPQVWIRVRPTGFDTPIFEIEEDSKSLKLQVKPEDRLFKKKMGRTACLTFETDGVLQNMNQDEVFELTTKEMVEKAMEGISGVLVCIGPEISGKSFTLFGPPNKYQLRGIVPRAVEFIFELAEAKKEIFGYHIILSMFEVRRDKIKDLLTLGPYELTRVGEFGPQGLFLEEVTSVDHALGLILRGLSGQQQIPREPYAKSHTVVYFDIIAQTLIPNQKPEEWRSRITFAKIASIPSREQRTNVSLSKSFNGRSPSRAGVNGVQPSTSNCNDHNLVASDLKCCRGSPGTSTEIISIRKDISFLEQMFTRAYDVRKIQDYYAQLQSMGMYSNLLRRHPPKIHLSQYFRQSKLAHCLKDIVCGKALVRLILHVRPERTFLHSTIEVMRFAERARCIPCDIPKKVPKCQSLEENLIQMCENLGIVGGPELSNLSGQPEKMKGAFQLMTTYFEDKLDSLDGTCKDRVKSMFESFREMWSQMLEREARRVSQANKWNNIEIVEPQTDDQLLSIEQAEISEEHKLINLEVLEPPKRLIRSRDDAKSNAGDRSESRKKKRGVKSSASKDKSKTPRRSKAAILEDVSGDVADASKKKGRRRTKVNIGASSSADEDETNASEEGGLEETSEGNALSRDQNVTTELPPQVVVDDEISIMSMDGSTTKSPKQFKRKCWKAFIGTEAGELLCKEFVEKQALLKQCILDHNEIQREVTDVIADLTILQLNLDVLEEDKVISDPGRERASVILSKEPGIIQEVQGAVQNQDELLSRLKSLRLDISSQKSVVENQKIEVVKAFKTFCSDNFGKVPNLKKMPLSTLDRAVLAVSQEVLGFPKSDKTNSPESDETMAGDKSERDRMMAKRFETLNRVAKQQAQVLIKNAYSKRPPWATF